MVIKDTKKNKTVRIKTSHLKKLKVLSMLLNRKEQNILETGIIKYIQELEAQYCEEVIERRKASNE